MNKILLSVAALVSVYFLYNWFNQPVEKNIEQNIEISNEKKEEVAVVSASELLIGSWQSDTDPNLRREFNQDGSAVDRYLEGEISDATMLSWSLFSASNKDPDFEESYENGVNYLRLDNGRDFVFFKIVNLSETKLQLVYVDEPGGISFTRK